MIVGIRGLIKIKGKDPASLQIKFFCAHYFTIYKINKNPHNFCENLYKKL